MFDGFTTDVAGIVQNSTWKKEMAIASVMAKISSYNHSWLQLTIVSATLTNLVY